MGDSIDMLFSGLDHTLGGLAILLLANFLIFLQYYLCRMGSVAYTKPNESKSKENPTIIPTTSLNKETLDALPIFDTNQRVEIKDKIVLSISLNSKRMRNV